MAASVRKLILLPITQYSRRTSLSYLMLARHYAAPAKKIVGKVSAQSAQKSKLQVETDPEKLLKYCCGACIYVDGKDPEIKADSEYPDWLWTLHTERSPRDLSELDPMTPEYWVQISRFTKNRNKRVWKRLQKLKDIQYPDDKIGVS
ncbi:unnamed protein product [Candidula unifasciata]|uniref:Large ribosomal subunit protein mL54 n=1 Tax=Candidula unifasciata TaxID=100452 RepID=A0A8S3YV97_9EUPU|nr:unnamed protein product [Candidula unifasciata]